MNILVCVKRVPTVGGAITLTADSRAIDTKASGFTISPHEECAVEEAVRLVERFGGSVTVLSLGPAEAQEQLRACLALGASAAVLVETAPGAETGPMATAAALHSPAATRSASGLPTCSAGRWRPAPRRSRCPPTARRCRHRAATGA